MGGGLRVRVDILLFTGFLLMFILAACSGADEGAQGTQGGGPAFSSDTVSFGVVISDIGSSTRTLVVYNKGRSSLTIDGVALDKGRESAFRFNVDGRKGDVFRDLFLAAGDSLFVMIEVTAPFADSDKEVEVKDNLSFVAGGLTAKVVLTALGRDVIPVRGGLLIDRDTLLSAGRPYLVYDSIVVGEGVRMSVGRGAQFYMHSDARIVVNGQLEAVGTLDSPVIIRGDRFDNLLDDIPYDRVSNQWDGIYFGKNSFNSVFDHVIVRNGRSGLTFERSLTGRDKIRLYNSQITNMSDCVITASSCSITSANSEFSNAGGHVVGLFDGEYHFIHCTIVNYYVIRPGRRGTPALILERGEGSLLASFENSVVDGYLSTGVEPLGGEISVNGSPGHDISDMLFNHCALRTIIPESDERFRQTASISGETRVYYKMTGSGDNGYRYDFRPDTAKVLIGKADMAISAAYPLDRYGVDRITGPDGPDIGAYEYIPEK
jgi:hypothetical protein